MERALAAESVSKTYGETVALDDVSLGVERGEVLALVGPNGAGKTTLVRALTGTLTPDEGSVRVLGATPRELDRAALGVLPQAFRPPDRLSARELLGYYAGLYQDPRDPDGVLASVGLADSADVRYEALSGGQQRRVCLGAALVNDPEIVVLDEPTSGIDPAGRRTVRDIVEGLADDGSAVLVTTHDMPEAQRLADRVALLADGRLRAVGTPGELVAEHGGSSRLVVDVAPAAVDDAAEALDRAGVEVERRSDAVVAAALEPADVATVVSALEDAGVAYDEVAWRRPTLEDAFLALVDEDAPEAARDDDSRPRTADQPAAPERGREAAAELAADRGGDES